MTGKGDQVGVNKIPAQDEHDLAVAGNSEQVKAIVTVGQMNEMASEDIILSMDYKTKEVILAFKLIKNCCMTFQNDIAAWHGTCLLQITSHIQHHNISI